MSQLDSGADITKLHAQVVSSAQGYLARLNGANLPMIAGGDFNTDPIRDSNPSSAVMLRAGFTDAAATQDRTGAQYATFNGHNGGGGVDPGYPDTAVPHRYNTSRIDFIMMKGNATSFSYRNVLHLDGGRFDKSYQGSDHNLQLATIGIGAPQ